MCGQGFHVGAIEQNDLDAWFLHLWFSVKLGYLDIFQITVTTPSGVYTGIGVTIFQHVNLIY